MARKKYYQFRDVKYVDTYDGDTITVHIPNVHPLFGFRRRVRVRDIDTAEMRGTKGLPSIYRTAALAAKHETRRLLEGCKRLDLINVQIGSFNRLVANLIIDGKRLDSHLIERGLAVKSPQGQIKWRPTQRVRKYLKAHKLCEDCVEVPCVCHRQTARKSKGKRREKSVRRK